MSGSLGKRFPPVLQVGVQQERAAPVAQCCRVVPTPHHVAVVGIGSRGGKAGRVRERQKIAYVTVRKSHLFGDAMTAELLVELQKAPGLEGLVMSVKGLFASLEKIRNERRENEVQLPRF